MIHFNPVRINIIHDLLNSGYSVQTLDYGSFCKICEDLGAVVNTTQVKLNNDSSVSNLLAKPGAIPFHTDHPEIDIIAWYCINPGTGKDNHVHFIDGKEVIGKLTDEELNNLESVKVRFPPINNRLAGEASLLTLSLDGLKLYYAPWLIAPNQSPSRLDSINSFQKILLGSILIEVELFNSSCIFVNNHRILHGRNQIEKYSSRHLERNWIRFRERYASEAF